jgi:hypothetical protein
VNSRSVELFGDELSVPGQQRIRFATVANSSKAFRPSRWAISANVAFSPSESSSRLDLTSQDPVLCPKIFVPQQEFLIDRFPVT